MILFSIIVPTYERTNDLKKCLDCIENGKQFGMICTPKDANYEIIVTDDGNNNETQLLISQHFNGVKWIKGPSKGPAANRNNGAKVARGKWLVFTDDDCLPDKKWLTAFKYAVENNPNCDAFEGKISPLSDIDLEFACCPVNLNGDNFWSANIAISKEIFVKCGGFDENFPYPASEDQELYHRVKSITQPLFVKDAIVYHPVRIQTIPQSLIRNYRATISWIYFQEKHLASTHYSRTKHMLNNTKDGIYYCTRSLYKFRILEFVINLIETLVSMYTILMYKNKRR
jgi:glycosyltransferase involved in cell wall biosynthesis